MATRKQLWHPDEVKERIQASQLINRLNEHINSEKPGTLDASQVNAAVKLLNKVLPDMKAVEHTGEGGGAIQVNVTIGGSDSKPALPG